MCTISLSPAYYRVFNKLPNPLFQLNCPETESLHLETKTSSYLQHCGIISVQFGDKRHRGWIVYCEESDERILRCVLFKYECTATAFNVLGSHYCNNLPIGLRSESFFKFFKRKIKSIFYRTLPT